MLTYYKDEFMASSSYSVGLFSKVLWSLVKIYFCIQKKNPHHDGLSMSSNKSSVWIWFFIPNSRKTVSKCDSKLQNNLKEFGKCEIQICAYKLLIASSEEIFVQKTSPIPLKRKMETMECRAYFEEFN